MKALLVCSTYGRIPYLSTMLSGFLHQTYDDKHLVVINDDNNVELCCSHKNVTVINCNRRILLSEKRNIGIASGYHDIIFPYDDDDIFLPMRISNHMKEYEDPSVNAYRNTANYIIYGDNFGISGSPPNNVSFRKSEWFKIGGYYNPGNITGEDVEIYDKLTNKKVVENREELDFVYSWGGLNYHLTSGDKPKIDEIAYKQLQEMNLVGKKYWIEPNYEEYSKYLHLDRMYQEKQEDMQVKHVKHGEIDINHLLYV